MSEAIAILGDSVTDSYSCSLASFSFIPLFFRRPSRTSRGKPRRLHGLPISRSLKSRDAAPARDPRAAARRPATVLAVKCIPVVISPRIPRDSRFIDRECLWRPGDRSGLRNRGAPTLVKSSGSETALRDCYSTLAKPTALVSGFVVTGNSILRCRIIELAGKSRRI